jgi:hypothetical protein
MYVASLQAATANPAVHIERAGLASGHINVSGSEGATIVGITWRHSSDANAPRAFASGHAIEVGRARDA